MTLGRGRVRRANDSGQVERVSVSEPNGYARGARLDRIVVAATERARGVLSLAEQRAEDVIARAKAEGYAEGLAQFAAESMRLAERERGADEASLDRAVELAKLLAERLLRHALSLSPGEIASLARGALGEARGARRIRIHANPKDAEILSSVTEELDPDGRVHAVVPDPSLLPGDLRLETDVGTVDARLGAGLAQLAARLREALRA
jgi:flagellar biosynthesis/type III secretory pathway protein FliH